MNLEFIDISPQLREGRRFTLQRAIITPEVSAAFWSNWRVKENDIHKILTVRKEMVSNKPFWVVYRLKPLDDKNWGTFSCSYTIRNRSKLLPYQPKAVQFLCDAITRNNAALDGSDTGIGKTYVALAVCRELSLRPVIICKKSGISAWEKACMYMNIEPLIIINWESAKLGGKRFPYVTRGKLPYENSYSYRWKIPKGILIIFDEAHAANHDDSQNCAFYCASHGLTSLSLSATFSDRPARMKPFFYMVGAMSQDEYSGFLQSQGNFNNLYNQLESLSEVDDMKKINSILFPRFGYRISYDDPDVKKFFPEGVYQTHIINLSKKDELKQNTLYQELLIKVEDYRIKGNNAGALVENMRYRQAAELLKAPVLSEMVQDYINEGKSVAVFVNFRETLAYLAKVLKTRSMIFGDQEKFHLSRKDVLNAFQSNKAHIILCMADAGGISLDLHDVIGGRPRISLICPTYNPITLKQVLGRTRRAGSKTIPIMKLVYAAGTIEEKVVNIVNSKLANISALNDGDLMEPDLFKILKGQ